MELVRVAGEVLLGRVPLGEQARARDLDEVLEHVDLHRGAGGVVAVAQRVGERLSDGLERDLGDLLAAHAGPADDDLAADVPDDVALGQVEQLEHRALLPAHVGDLRLGVRLEQAELHPGAQAVALAQQHVGRVGERAVCRDEPEPVELVARAREPGGDAARLVAEPHEVAQRLLVDVGHGAAGRLGVPGVAGAVALDDRRAELGGRHRLVGRSDADEVPAVRRVRPFDPGESDADVRPAVIRGKAFDGGGYGRLYLVGDPACDLADGGVGDLLADDVAVVLDAEVQLAAAVLVEHGADGLQGLLVLARGLFELDGFALAAQVHLRPPPFT